MKTHRATLSGASNTLSALSCDTAASYCSDTGPDSDHNLSVSSLPGVGGDHVATPSPDPDPGHAPYRSVSSSGLFLRQILEDYCALQLVCLFTFHAYVNS